MSERNDGIYAGGHGGWTGEERIMKFKTKRQAEAEACSLGMRLIYDHPCITKWSNGSRDLLFLPDVAYGSYGEYSIRDTLPGEATGLRKS